MTYIKNNLANEEMIVYQAKIHWAAYIYPIFLLFIGYDFFKTTPIITVITWAIGVLSILDLLNTELAITNKRAIGKTGIIRRESIELRHAALESLKIKQGILGRIFGYGIVTVVGTGGTKVPFKGIDAPLEFRRQVNNVSNQLG